MLDKRSIALLNAINKQCNGFEYKIFSVEELISFLPVRLSLDLEGVKEALSSLNDYELISIKYQDDSEVCLRPLIKGRVAIENLNDKEQAEGRLKHKLILFSFLGGLVGGLLSGLLCYFLGVN